MTERLEIRAVTAADSAACRGVFVDPQATQRANGRAESEEWQFTDIVWRTQRVLKEPATWMGNSGPIGFAVLEKARGQSLGMLSLHQDYPGAYFETGLMLYAGEKFENWNRGLGTEALRASLPFVFETLGAPGIIAIVSSTNPASQRVFEKLGFRYIRNVPPRHVPLDPTATWREFRLSRESYYRLAAPIAESEGPNTAQIVTSMQNARLPPTSRLNLIYAALMRDAGLRASLPPEFLSVAAEQIAYGHTEAGEALAAQIQQVIKISKP